MRLLAACPRAGRNLFWRETGDSLQAGSRFDVVQAGQEAITSRPEIGRPLWRTRI